MMILNENNDSQSNFSRLNKYFLHSYNIHRFKIKMHIFETNLIQYIYFYKQTVGKYHKY